MIQRKQTLYLLLAAGLMVSMMFFDLATFTLSNNTSAEPITITQADGSITKTTILGSDTVSLKLWGLYSNGQKTSDTVFLTVLFAICTLMAFAAIFFYKRREIQAMLCTATAILLAVFAGYLGIYIYKLTDMFHGYEAGHSAISLFPLLAILLVYMAYQGIKKDIALLRSVDRIR